MWSIFVELERVDKVQVRYHPSRRSSFVSEVISSCAPSFLCRPHTPPPSASSEKNHPVCWNCGEVGVWYFCSLGKVLMASGGVLCMRMMVFELFPECRAKKRIS